MSKFLASSENSLYLISKVNIYKNTIRLNHQTKPKILDESIFDNASFRGFSTTKPHTSDNFDYGIVSEETLIALASKFESFEEFCEADYDVTYSDGVLTVNFPKGSGVYVINKQAPNKQIWLSSPLSGPKRYDFKDNKWIYNGISLHQLLQEEVPKLLNVRDEIDFTDLPYS